ncbi:hypothetical protein SEA_KEELAN_87 [Gordonia phage Keelan]|nr:hypothetical protein SEA_KEELAN_87 [Gordonia phage Keelan]
MNLPSMHLPFELGFKTQVAFRNTGILTWIVLLGLTIAYFTWFLVVYGDVNGHEINTWLESFWMVSVVVLIIHAFAALPGMVIGGICIGDWYDGLPYNERERVAGKEAKERYKSYLDYRGY